MEQEKPLIGCTAHCDRFNLYVWHKKRHKRLRPPSIGGLFLLISLEFLAPQVGLEPTTLRLTAECSAIELLRNKRPHIVRKTICRARKRFYNRWVFERQPNSTRQRQYALNLRSETICENISNFDSPSRKVLEWNAAQHPGIAQT